MKCLGKNCVWKGIYYYTDRSGRYVSGALILLETSIFSALNHLTRVICQELRMRRISLYCLSATYSFWSRVDKFYLQAKLLYLPFYGSNTTFFGGTRADCHRKVTWQLCRKTYTYYIGSDLFFSCLSSAPDNLWFSGATLEGTGHVRWWEGWMPGCYLHRWRDALGFKTQ